MDQDPLGLDLDEEAPPLIQKKWLKLAGFLAGGALLAAGGFLVWKHQTAVSEQEYLNRAQTALQAGELSAAIIELKNAIEANRQNTRSRLTLAETYLRLGLGAEAEEQIHLAREAGARGEQVAIPLAEALMLQRKYQKALEEIQLSEQEEPEARLQFQRIRADALLGLGKLDEACPLYLETLALDSKHVPAYWGLVKCAMARKDFPGAQADMAAALKLEPRNVRSLMLKGAVAQAMEDLSAAEAAYGEAIAADPKSLPAWIARASARLAAGKMEQAAADVQAAKKLAPDILMVRYLDASVAYHQERFAEAQNILRGILGRVPDHQPSRLLSGMVAFRMGQFRTADKDLAQVLLWQPGNRDVRLLLASSRLQSAQAEGALAALEPLLADKDNPSAEAFSIAGDAYMQLGKAEKAEEYVDKAASLLPGQVVLRSKVGLWRLKAGDAAGATKEFEAAAKMQALPLQTEVLRISTLLMRKDFDAALALAQALEKRFPDQAIPHNLKGMAYLGKKNEGEARRSFQRSLAMEPTNVATARSLAQLDLLRGKLDAASAHYESVLKRDADNYEALMELAQLARAQKRSTEYATLLTRAAGAAPAETPPRILLARHFLEAKAPIKALTWARQAVDLNPDNPLALELLGDVQLANGEKDNALYSYMQWKLLAPNSALAHLKLGKAQATVGHLTLARESFDRALRLKPDNADAVMAALLLARQEGRHQDAIRHARQLQLNHPRMWEGHALEGDSHAALGQHADAVQPYTRAFALRRSNKLFIRLHQALTRAGRAQEASQLLAAWLRDAPADLATRLYLGYNHLQAGRNTEAQAEFRLALQAQGTSVPAMVGMSAALDALGDTRTSLRYAEKAYQQSGNDAATSDLLGWMLVARGDPQRGLELLQRATSLEPDNTTFRFHLAAALAKKGDSRLARHMLKMLLAKGGDFPKRAEAQALLKSLPPDTQPQ